MGKKRITIRSHDDFRCRLARAVGIVAAERIGFFKTTRLTSVLVAFVGRDHDDGAGKIRLANGFEQIRGAEHVGRDGFHRLAVGNAHERLRGEVENELGLPVANRVLKLMRIPDVLNGVLHPALQFEREEQRLLRRGQRQSVHVCAEAEQPFAKPRALETSMAGDEHALAGVGAQRIGEVHGYDCSEPRLLGQER